MTFDELKLCMAIQRANLKGKDRTSERDRHSAANLVFMHWLRLFKDSRFPWTIDEVSRHVMNCRKSTSNKLKAEVALAHGSECYFKNRGKGPCCGDAELGHIVPRSENGPDVVSNCQIECHAHNSQRGCGSKVMTIEEYLASDLTTEASCQSKP